MESRVGFMFLLSLLGASAASVDEVRSLLNPRTLKCDGDYSSLQAGDTCVTTWAKLTKGSHQLRPTEPSVGWSWVARQMDAHFSSVKKSTKWFSSHTLPVALGGSDFYLTDSHHHMLAVQLTGDADIWDLEITLDVLCDLRDAGDNFWPEMVKNNYAFLYAWSDTDRFALPQSIDPSALPMDWQLSSYSDSLWRSLAGFSSHVADEDSRCYVKECEYFIDYEWAYVFGQSMLDTSLWPSQAEAEAFKANVESASVRPDISAVDLAQWDALGQALLPLCHSGAVKGFSLPSAFPSDTLAGWSTSPLPADPDCSTSTCPANLGGVRVV